MSEIPLLMVDFFGPPGVGKSSIAAKLADEFSLSGRSVAEPTYELSHNIGRWKSHLYKAPRSLSALRDSRVNLPKGNLINEPLGTIRASYNWLFISDVILDASDTEIVIFDQGIIQAVWSYGYLTNSQIDIQVMNKGLDIVPEEQKYLAIYVTASPEEIHNRLNERSGGVQPDEFVEELADLKNGVRSFEKLLTHVDSVMENRPNQSVISINNSNQSSPQQCAETIHSKIKDQQDL